MKKKFRVAYGPLLLLNNKHPWSLFLKGNHAFQKPKYVIDYWLAPPSIHRGLEWPQSLNRLFDCKFSHFSSPHPPLCSTVSSVIYWPAPPSIHRGLEWAQSLNRFSDCLFDCSLLDCKFSHFSSPHLLFYSTVSSVIYL